MKDKLIITKKGVKGEDGYKVFSIRIKDELVEKLDQLAENYEKHEETSGSCPRARPGCRACRSILCHLREKGRLHADLLPHLRC